MAEDEFNPDDPGSGGGSEDSLDDFFQPAGGKSDKAAGGAPAVDDFFAPPSGSPKAKPAQPAKPAASELPILKSNFGQFADEPESMKTPLTELAASALEPTPTEAAAAEKKSFMAHALTPLAFVLGKACGSANPSLARRS